MRRVQRCVLGFSVLASDSQGHQLAAWTLVDEAETIQDTSMLDHPRVTMLTATKDGRADQKDIQNFLAQKT